MKSRLLQTLLIATVLSPGLGVATNLDAPTAKKDKLSATSQCSMKGNWCKSDSDCCPDQGLTCKDYNCCQGNSCDSGGGPLLKK
jgi:hypothetical protein